MPGDTKIELTEEELTAKIADAVKTANAGIEKSRNEVLAEKKAMQEELRAEKARIAELELAAQATQKGVSGDELKKIREQMRVDMDKEYAPIKEQNDRIAKENRQLKLDNVVKAKMLDVGVRGERAEALFKLTADRFELLDDGTPCLAGKPGADLKKFLGEDLKTEYPEFYNGSGSSGGGASRSSTAGSGGKRVIAAADIPKFAKEVASGEVLVETPE